MLATLNSRQIVDEIVKDTVKDNDPHDVIQIAQDVVRASRVSSEAATLAPDLAIRPEPKFAPEPTVTTEPTVRTQPETQQAVPPVETGLRVTASDNHVPRNRSAAGRWLRGAFVMVLLAGGSAAATIAWAKHGDTAKRMLAEWMPAVASLLPATPQTAPVAAMQAAPPAAADQSAAPVAVPVAAAATTADAAPSVDSMSRDISAMAQQIDQLKASIAELKAAQEQMARDMTKPAAQKPVAESRPPADPRAHMPALAQRTQAPPPLKPKPKPKPVVSHTYMPAYSPPPPASPPSTAVATPPPPVATTQTVADDDGPVVRPPMPLR